MAHGFRTDAEGRGKLEVTQGKVASELGRFVSAAVMKLELSILC